MLPEESTEQLQGKIQIIKSMFTKPSHLYSNVVEISETPLPVATPQAPIDYALLIKTRVSQKPVREFVKEIANLYGGIM